MAVLGGDFSGYETITFDPGWAFTVGVIVICSLLNLSLPLLLRLAKHWDDKKIDQKTGVRSNVRNLLEDNVDIDANDIRSEMSASPKKRRRLHTQSPSHAPSAFSDYQSAFSADYHSTAKSVISSTAISQIASNILEARPRKNRRHILTKTSKEPKRSADNPPRKQTPASLGDPLADFDESSVCASIMSNLDQDAVSVRDAIDAHDGATNHKIQVDQTSPNGLWECLLDIAEWEFEMKRMSSLTIPYSIQGVADGLFQIINVAMIGNLIGVREANAYVVVTILIEWTNTITYGFCEGKEVFIAGMCTH